MGIGENSPSMFTDPLFGKLKVKQARLVVSYNVMTSGDDELPGSARTSRPRSSRASARSSRSSMPAATRRSAS